MSDFGGTNSHRNLHRQERAEFSASTSRSDESDD
jgi:hypothetical protein